MTTEKKKKIPLFSPLFWLVSALILTFIALTPLIEYEEGGFLNSIMPVIFDALDQKVGFFKTGNLAGFSLFPVVAFCSVMALQSVSRTRWVIRLLSIVSFACAYVFLSCVQSFHVFIPRICMVPSLVLFVMAVCGIITLVASKERMRRKAIAKVRKRIGRKNTDAPAQETDPEKAEFERKVAELSEEKALEMLESVYVPGYENFGTYSLDGTISNPMGASSMNDIAEEVLELDRETRQSLKEHSDEQLERLEDVFDVSSRSPEPAENKAEEIEDIDFIDFYEEESGYGGDTGFEEPSETEIEPLSPIVDEGTTEDSSEDNLEAAAEKYRRLKEDAETPESDRTDFVSGVMGLKSSKQGGYYYDSSKFEYKFPSDRLLKHYEQAQTADVAADYEKDGRIIVETLRQFRIETQLIGIQHGPTFTLYELSLAKGIRVNAVLTLADNIAMDLAVQSVRILAPIPGKAAIGIEVPNRTRDTIGFDSMVSALRSKTLKIPMVLGKTITGESIIVDLAGAPHMLIAGTTGSGKSVCVNSLICSVLYTKTPKEVRMILVDPKMVELTVYNDIPHLLTPVITNPKKAIKAMAFCVEEMERRMAMFSQLGARKIEDYNQKIVEKGLLREPLPYIMVIIDEFADLMMVVGKELESYIKRITAVARFTGIHLVLATQRPSADVITGIIKSNMPTQIAFAVSNQLNSRIILDTVGAEKLLGRGDMLYASASNRVPVRIQGAYIDSEIESIVDFVKTQGEPDYIDESYFEDEEDDEQEENNGFASLGGSEDLLSRAWKIVADRGEASASYLQRRLSIGYNRAANLIEQMEDLGYIGPARGSKPREILRYPDSSGEGQQ